MNDPHVAALLYRVEHGESVDYKEAEPLVRDESAFRLEVEEKQARFELKEHYATEEDAREAIEDYIRAWEFSACLENGSDSFQLKFHKAEIVDRNPTPGAAYFHLETGTPCVTFTPVVIKQSYPLPPSNISITPDIQTMFDRYMNYLNYRRRVDQLTDMANFCLTMLEHMAGNIKRINESNRKAASRYFQIDMEILREIGRLASTKGGRSGARKATGVNAELTQQERRFLDEAIRKMILRAAEKAHSPDADSPKISLSDLPPI